MTNIPYLIYLAERDKTLAERRAEAQNQGELAAAFRRGIRTLASPLARRAPRGPGGHDQSGFRRARSRQNWLPSGSARTCQDSAPLWPTSAGRAPSMSSRSSSAS